MWDPKPDAPVEIRGEFGTIPTNVPGIRLSRHAADVRADHGQVVDRPQPAPPRRGPLDRRPDLLHRLQPRARTPTRTSIPRCGSIVSKQLGHLNPHAAGLRDDPADGARHGLGVPRRRAQAVRDAGRPRATAARSSCRTSSSPRGVTLEQVGDRKALLQGLRQACAATSTERVNSTPSTSSSRRRGRSSPRPPRATRSTSTASRRSSASATASCPRSTRRPRTAAVRRTGASGCCSRGGWSKRACGW